MIFQSLVLLVVCAVAISGVTTTFSTTSLTKFNDFVKTPHSNSASGNSADETIHTGGRLIDRHLEYIAQAGYKSILSVVEYATNDTLYNGVSGNFPSSDYEMSIAKSFGLEAQYFASSLTVESAQAISKLLNTMPKPIYVHCHVGYSANLFTQLHFYLTKQISAEDIYPHSLNMGFDYQNNSGVVSLVNSITGRDDVTTPAQIEQNLAEGEDSYRYYYWTHRLGNSDQFFNIGQVLSTHAASIKTAGYSSVVVMRQNGEPTARLPTDPATGPVANYEFSDETGAYSVALEEKVMRAAGLHFYYLPLVSGSASTWTKATFDRYAPILSKVTALGPALVHCASGYRSSSFTLTYLASLKKECSTWVVDQAHMIGFDLTTDVDVMAFSKEILGC
jgi:protein tyrosine phosphatase (PTP) superfamily phosphohydrolase (DUF442 family)